jgi:uncharacterized OsmC-like protein
MTLMTAKYLGGLRVECRHEQSGAVIVTDAPTDNHGKGEAFSPSDLCGIAVGACAMTIMGFYASAHDCDITGTTISVDKKMSANPRRLGSLEIVFTMPDREFTDKQKQGLERAAHTCPVHLSLHPDIEQTFIFRWAR